MSVMKKILLLAFFVLFVAQIVSAAVIEGEIYTIYLEPLDNVIVEIDSVPHQIVVSKDGLYSFTVVPGVYVITAQKSNGETYSVEEIITVVDDGTYTLDLLLMPIFEENIEGFDEVDVFESEGAGLSKTGDFLLYLSLLIFVLVIVYLIMTRKHYHGHEPEEKKEEELSSDLDEQVEQVLRYLKQEEGRVNQKEIRKVFHMSEAKMSLLIADMESRGLVKKIKKGRGNIIILQ